MKFLYLILGLVISFNATMQALEKTVSERERTITYIQSLQTCQFLVVTKKLEASDEFCKEYAANQKENFSDISAMMDKITDKKYSIYNVYKSLMNL